MRVEIFTIRQNDHLLGSWLEHAKAVWVKPFLLAEGDEHEATAIHRGRGRLGGISACRASAARM